MSRFVFPEWTQTFKKAVLLLVAGGPVYLILLIWYGVSAEAIRIGYQPKQPVPYSHALHVGELGLDCRYCHNTVEKSWHAAVPPADTCMNCHATIRADSKALGPIRDSYGTGEPVNWVRVHDLPDYVFFNHSAHVARTVAVDSQGQELGIGCESCHGRIDLMDEVYQAEPLTMGWCIDCHRDPFPNLRPRSEITTMGKQFPGLQKPANYDKQEDCSTCHR